MSPSKQVWHLGGFWLACFVMRGDLGDSSAAPGLCVHSLCFLGFSSLETLFLMAATELVESCLISAVSIYF